MSARIALPAEAELDEAQRRVYHEIIGGRRGTIVGPLRAALHSPELAERWSRLGEFLRYSTSLSPRLKELAIVVTGRRWSAQIEWIVHARAAIEAGVPAHIIADIEALRSPSFDDGDDAAVYEFTRQLQVCGWVEADCHAEATRRLGVRGVVELTAVIGYYTMVAMTLNAHDMPTPDGTRPLPDFGLVNLPAAAR